MRRGKVFGLSFLFGLLAIVIVMVAVLIVLLSPFLLVFTGLWILWFVTRDFDKSDSSEDD